MLERILSKLYAPVDCIASLLRLRNSLSVSAYRPIIKLLFSILETDVIPDKGVIIVIILVELLLIGPYSLFINWASISPVDPMVISSFKIQNAPVDSSLILKSSAVILVLGAPIILKSHKDLAEGNL